jgi:hypothetical protein
MNGAASLFVNARARGWAPRLAAGGLCGLLLAGCQSVVPNPLASHPVDPASPVAAEVAKAADADAKFPSFLDIPDLPKDVRPAETFGKAVADTEAAGEALAKQTAPSTWTLSNTDTFASRAQGRAGEEDAPRPGEDTEAYAKRLRERATPPPLTR